MRDRRANHAREAPEGLTDGTANAGEGQSARLLLSVRCSAQLERTVQVERAIKATASVLSVFGGASHLAVKPRAVYVAPGTTVSYGVVWAAAVSDWSRQFSLKAGM